jgi:hypothetical protein
VAHRPGARDPQPARAKATPGRRAPTLAVPSLRQSGPWRPPLPGYSRMHQRSTASRSRRRKALPPVLTRLPQNRGNDPDDRYSTLVYLRRLELFSHGDNSMERAGNYRVVSFHGIWRRIGPAPVCLLNNARHELLLRRLRLLWLRDWWRR